MTTVIINTLDRGGIAPAKPTRLEGPRGPYWAFAHGERGRGRWQYRLPIAGPASDTPPPSGPYTLHAIRTADGAPRLDAAGNPLYILRRARALEADAQLILWHLSPGYRGSATYTLGGHAEILAAGEEAQGIAGRMGGAPCPVVLVRGPCQLRWHRTGRLYGTPADWVAAFNGRRWAVGPEDDMVLADACAAADEEDPGHA